MSNVVLNAYSRAYPFIVNRIRASVYLQSDPQALISSIIDSTAGHPARTWSFPGLPQNNYGFTLDEIDGSGNPTGNNLASFDVVPGETEGTLTRDDEQLILDTTVGFNSGDNSFTFDGTGGKPDFIGWSIVPSELTGRGILKNSEYSWDATTGQLTLLELGDVFQADWNIHFNSKNNVLTDSVTTIFDFSVEFLTAAGNIDVTLFGKKLIIDLVGTYGEFQLPDINTVPSGRRLMVEIGGTAFCCKFLPFGSNVINFCRGNLFALSNEKFSIYKIIRGDGTKEWRVDDENGNFFSCGRIVSEDNLVANLFNMHLLDGGIVTLGSIYDRIYNEVVLNLPVTQRCNFDDWNTGNNKYLYSLANSSNPADLNKFHFPDRRNLYERNNNTGKAGDYQADEVGPINLHIPLASSSNNPGSYVYGRSGPLGGNPDAQFTLNGTGAETKPKSYLINKYVLL